MLRVQRAWAPIWAVKALRTSSSPSVYFLLSWSIPWYTIPCADLAVRDGALRWAGQ